MRQVRRDIPTVAVISAVLVVAVGALIASNIPGPVRPSTSDPAPPPNPAASTPPLVSPSPRGSVPQCTEFFTPPPYDSFTPIPGITVRAVDKAHFEITNSTLGTYYVGVAQWVTEDDLICGRGVIAHSSPGGQLPRNGTFQGTGGSEPEAPLVVSIWDDPCGDECTRPPVGKYVVPVSPVDPPAPGAS